MKIAIVYDSSTGTTAKAAETMGKTLEAHGHQCRVQSVSQADPADVSEADLICIGSWVKGLFIIRQHPTEGTMRFIEQLGNLAGKKCRRLLHLQVGDGINFAANGAGAGRKRGESSRSVQVSRPRTKAVSSHRLPASLTEMPLGTKYVIGLRDDLRGICQDANFHLAEEN